MNETAKIQNVKTFIVMNFYNSQLHYMYMYYGLLKLRIIKNSEN